MAKWFHRVDLDWLKARQDALSATDIKQLLPVTKTGRARKVTEEDYWKIRATKAVELTEADCESNGAAARGHILEPYAIDMFNECIGEKEGEILYHWDDVLLMSPNDVLGFSPDALSIKQDPDCPPSMVLGGTEPFFIGEVKSYGADRHAICGHTPKHLLEERWQIAAAMACYENIDHAWLMFYNPSMREQLYVIRYDRDDLAEEIDICLQISTDWYDWRQKGGKRENTTFLGDPRREQEIIEEIIERESLDPDGFRTVIA